VGWQELYKYATYACLNRLYSEKYTIVAVFLLFIK